MPLSSVTGNYTAVSGAETATAGQTIASATWDSINADYRAALSQVGQVIYLQSDGFRYAVRTVSLSTANTDLAVSIPIPGGSPAYQVLGVEIANATANASAAVVGLFTAAAGGGTAIVTASTAVTVTTSVVGTNNNMQSFTVNNQNTQAFNTSPLFFRVGTTTATAAVDLFITIRPL